MNTSTLSGHLKAQLGNPSTWLVEEDAELEASLGSTMRLRLKKLQKEKGTGLARWLSV